MRRTGSHTHFCCNRKQGCKSSYECSNENLDSNYDGWPDPVCGINPMNDQECEDCSTSRCSACGAVLNIEKCDPDCEKYTQV